MQYMNMNFDRVRPRMARTPSVCIFNPMERPASAQTSVRPRQSHTLCSPPPTECGQHYSKNTHEVEILNSQIHYDFNSRRLYGKIEIAQHTSSEEKLFLTAKVFNSRTKDRLQKFRLGKGEFPLYWMNVGPECASTMVLKFDGVIPSEYNFDNADSLRVKIKRGKKDSVACGNFYRVPLFNHDHHH